MPDTDMRECVRAMLPAKPCPFCLLDPARILAEDALVVIYKDGFPVSPGHTVILPRRHFATLFGATPWEQSALLAALGRAGGQSVPHPHIHLIPRYLGDKEDPRGGVRWVLPRRLSGRA